MDGVNSVKFEYDSQNNCIESIEDKDGDEVYLCPLCKQLFWSNKHYEKKGQRALKYTNILPDLLTTEDINFLIKNKL